MRAHARVAVRGTRAPFFTEDYVQRVWPLYSGSGFFPALILFALLGTLSAEAAAQLRELKGVMQAIAKPGVDASAA